MPRPTSKPGAAKAQNGKEERQVITTNRKARHDYTIIETFEAGIELRGTEVKSLRDSKAQLTDAYATVESGQLYLRNAHISIYDPGSYSNHEPTRTRRLLMHKIVRHGYCPRSHDSDEQIIEVLRRFDLAELISPYTRCLQCNGLLERVDKADVLEELEPLTKIHYQDFRRCIACRKIYWSGSHFGKLETRLGKIRHALLTRAP